MKRKTKLQKSVLRNHKHIPVFWVIINDRKDALLVMNWLTGEFQVLDK